MRSPLVQDPGGFSFLPEIAVSFIMQKLVRILFCLSLVSLVSLDSCVYQDIPEYECIETYSFASDIKPIIESKCAISGCHNGDMGSDLNWTDFDKFHQRVESGLVKYRVTHRIMPPSFSPEGHPFRI
jgi:hypothetical protein